MPFDLVVLAPFFTTETSTWSYLAVHGETEDSMDHQGIRQTLPRLACRVVVPEENTM